MAERSRALARRVGALGAACTVAAAAGCAAQSGPVPRQALVAATTTAPAQPPASPTPSTRSMTRVFDAIQRRYRSQILGICMGAIDERTQAIKCYGRTGPGSRRRPTPSTLFQVGSVSKTFAATLLALRVVEGKARLSDPVRDYIPAADAQASVPGTLTLLQLADHYSGLPREAPVRDSSSIAGLDDYLSLVGRCETTPGCPAGRPGRRYLYSNYAFGVLGQVLGLRDGYAESTYSAWEKDNAATVTGPLGMSATRSGLGWRATASGRFDALRARPAQAHTPAFFVPGPYGDPAGGLYSSANDMLKWLGFNMGLIGTPALNAARPLLFATPSLLRSRFAPPDPRQRVGLAWNVDSRGSGRSATTCVSKDGLSRGFTANVVFVKGQPRGAFVLLNTTPDTPARAIANDLVNSLPRLRGATRPVCPMSRTSGD